MPIPFTQQESSVVPDLQASGTPDIELADSDYCIDTGPSKDGHLVKGAVDSQQRIASDCPTAKCLLDFGLTESKAGPQTDHLKEWRIGRSPTLSASVGISVCAYANRRTEMDPGLSFSHLKHRLVRIRTPAQTSYLDRPVRRHFKRS